MKDEGSLFARAVLDGDVWRDSLVHDEECLWCRELRDPGPEPAGAGAGPGQSLHPDPVRHWPVVVSAVMMVAAVLVAWMS